jgi:hypothetical protein
MRLATLALLGSVMAWRPAGESPSHFRKISAPPANRPKRNPSQTKKNQGSGLGFSWINLDSFVRFGAFQRVTGNPKQKNVADRRRQCSSAQPKICPTATGIEPQLARSAASPSMPASLSVPPPWRLVEDLNMAWIANNIKNKTRIFL